MVFDRFVKKLVSIFVILSMLMTPIPAYASVEDETQTYPLLSLKHQATLNSLLNQINSKGIGVWAVSEEEALSPSGIDNRTRVAYEIVETARAGYESDQTAVIRFSLTNPQDREVSFDYAIYPGSASTERYDATQTRGTVTFGVGETEKELEITIPKLDNNPVEYGIASDLGDFWTGDKVFYIHCSNIRNALFANDKETVTLPVAIENSVDLQEAYANAVSTPLIDLNDQTKITGAVSFPETPGKYRNTTEGGIRITGAPLEGDIRTMIDMGVFSHMSMPVGYFSYSPTGEEPETGEIGFRVEKYAVFPSDPSEPIGPSPTGFERMITVEGNSETSFGLEESGKVEIAQVGLGRGMESNGGLAKSLNFVFDYSMLSEEVFTYFHDEEGNYIPEQVYFSDQIKPRVEYVTIPEGNFYPGESIPITIWYSEPVIIDDIVIEANGQMFTPLERKGTISETVSFLYEIDGNEESENAVRITSVTGAVDLGGNSQEEAGGYYLPYSLGDFIPEKALSYYGRTSVNINPGETQGEILLSIGNNTDLRDWLGENIEGEDNLVKVVKARVIGKDGPVDVPLYADSPIFMTQLKGVFEVPSNDSGQAIYYMAEIYIDNDPADEQAFELVYGLSKLYTVGPLIFIDDENDLEIIYQSWPSTNKVAADSTDPITLGYEVKVNATWQEAEDFSWSSNNEAVATINSAGEITLTGEPGSVSFTLKAHNGGQADEFSLTSKTLEVVIAEAGFLNVPESGRNVEVQKGSNARISYSTNLILRNDLFGGSGTATPFTYTLYEAVYEGTELQKGEQLHQETLKATVETPLLFYTIAGERLVKTTPKGKYGYILEISAVDRQTEQLFTAAVNIRVKDLPARAVLQKPATYYQTDADAGITVNFQIENATADSELLLTVVKNQDSEPVFTAQAASDMGKDLKIAIVPVESNRLLDVYTVSLKARNESNETFSYDSYTLYVYNADALKIMVDGEARDQLTMSLEDELSQMSSQELLAFNRKFRLTNEISINNKEYKWSRVADRIVWEVGDEGKISLKYNDGGIYRNIEDYSLPGFLPGDSFLLEGISDGSTSVTATHALTGMKAQMAVQVDRLEEKLFFFQAYPAVECEISYINGNGLEKRATTDSQGRYAVYEKSGIVSDVTFRPTSTLGTYDYAVLKHEVLKGNQNAAKDYGLYPQNIVTLPRMNYQLDLQLYDSASKMAYTEDLVIRGGVYRNGRYCPSATINGKKGNEDQIVKNDHGYYTLNFNPQEFTAAGNANPLGPEDKVEYVIELRFPEGTYYNKFITIDSDTIALYRYYRMPVIQDEEITPVNSGSIKDKLTIISQTFVIDDEEKPVPREFYYDKMPEKALLKIDLLFSGGPYYSYHFLLLDEYGRPWLSGEETSKTYEFSDTVILSGTLDIRFLMERLKPGEKVACGIRVSGYDLNAGSFTVQGMIPDCLTIYNVINIPSMSQNLQNGDLADVASGIIDLTWEPNIGSIEIFDHEVGNALNFIADYSISTDSIRLEIEPTEDPFLYKGVIKFAAGDLTRENPSGVFSAKVEGRENLSFVPGLSDMKAMKKGDYLKKSKEKMESSMKGSKGSYKTYGGGAYLECEIYYDVWDQEWRIRPLVTDIYLGAGGGYVRKENLMVGPVPVTAEFRAGFTAQVGMKNFVEEHEIFGKLNSTIYELRPYFYLYGFGGIGQDYEVVSFEVGPYGKISLDQIYLLYDNSRGQSWGGQKITIAGSTGVKFEVSLLFAKYSKTFEIARASKSWTLNSFNEIYELYESVGIKSKSRMMLESSPAEEPEISLVPVESKATLEDRTYLDTFIRQWGSPKSKSFAPLGYPAALGAPGVTVLETNTYPNANPVMADDGSLLVYLSDMDSKEIKDTAVVYSVRNEDGSYPEGTEISPADYPDSDAVIAGTAGGAVVAWNRVFSDFSKGAGDEATYEDFVNIYFGAEIMAGVYKDGKFTVEQLTNNSTPDIAPAVATNGNKAIVVWRSVSLGDGENYLDFTQDNIMYSIYDGTNWSEAKCLYEGNIDKVKALNAAMLSDGTAAVTYEIAVQDTGTEEKDTEEVFTVDNREIICAVLDSKGEITNIRLTNNASSDRNPQITAVEFPDGIERFVIGWNASRELDSEGEQDTVRLSALDGNGRLYPEFDMEIADNAGNSNYQNFKFAKGAKNLEELSILWAEPEVTGLTASDSETIYKENIWGKQFLLEDDGNYALSGKQKLVELPDNNGVNFFESYIDAKNNELNFSLLLSETGDEGKRANMATARSTYQNSLAVEEPYFSYEDILPGLDIPILFRLYNEGVEPIDRVTIDLGGETHTFEEKIKPGEYKNITALYKVSDTIVNPVYSITAKFATTEDTVGGTLKMDLPDVDIYKVNMTKETERERKFKVQLRNNSYAKLEEGKHVVKVEVYDTPNFSDNTPIMVETLSDAESLNGINEGTLLLDVTLKEEDLHGILDSNGEIPEDGARIFFRTILEEKEDPKGDGVPIEDADISNDMDYVIIHSLLTQKGTLVSISSMMIRESNQTVVQVEAFNNSMNKITNGNIIVNLIDENGRVLGTRQTYQPETGSASLLSVEGEEGTQQTFVFPIPGASMEAVFAQVVPASSKLSVLKFSGVPLDFDQDVCQYDLRVTDLSKTSLTIVAENPGAEIMALKNGTPVSLTMPCSLSFGANEFIIRVRTGGNEVTYNVNIYNEKSGNDDIGNSGKSNNGGNDSKASEKTTVPSISGAVRLSGSTRIDTAIEIAKAAFTGTIRSAVLTTADNYPDALTGSVLAYKLNGPILLVGSSAEDQEKVMEYLKSSLEPGGTVYILGGPAVVSRDIEDKLADAGIKQQIRIYGADRYETAVNIVKQLEVKKGTPVVLVSGEDFPDALSISSIAAKSQYPVLPVLKDGMNDVVKEEIASISPKKVYIIGLQGAISSRVEDKVARITGLDSENIIRIGSTDRYETALKVAQYFDYDSNTVCIATGKDFPDALTGSIFAAIYKAPIILADGSLSDEAINYIQSKKPTGSAVFGGPSAVDQEIVQQLEQLIK